ncbi:hypothetical protein [Flavobacterium anhuiense]|uniref:hypothetical protein n=1 Tax=Flavobacterium anhuiense TaxID=459526 RepID=UPI003D972A74
MDKIYWINRWKTLPKEIRIIFTISFPLIVFIELIFGQFTAYNYFWYSFGQFVLKLSYTCATTTIFYFLVQHLPKEKKRIKLHLLLSFKIGHIENQIQLLAKELFGDDEFKLIKQLTLIKCSKIFSTLETNATRTVNGFYIKGTFTNQEYFKASISNILQLCDEVLVFNDVLDSKIIHQVSRIKNYCENILRLNIYKDDYNLFLYHYDFFILIETSFQLQETLQEYSLNYYQESNKLNVVANKIKKRS